MFVTDSNELLLVFVFALILIAVLVYLIPAARGRRGNSHAGEPITQEYPDKHVHVTVPWQGYGVKVLRVPSPALDEMPPEREGEWPWPRRVLINVVCARQDDVDALVTHFDPPLVLRMAYSAEDLKSAQAKKLDNPIFGFWDGSRWVRFTAEKHHVTYEPNPHPTEEEAGYASVQLTAWSDPSIANGP